MKLYGIYIVCLIEIFKKKPFNQIPIVYEKPFTLRNSSRL